MAARYQWGKGSGKDATKLRERDATKQYYAEEPSDFVLLFYNML